MATRIKKITSTTSIAASTTVALSGDNTPSVTGDIVTRVLIDKVQITAPIGSPVAFSLMIGGRTVTFWNGPFNGLILMSGGNVQIPFVGPSYVPYAVIGAGTGYTGSANYHYWCPAQFYSSPGETLTASWSNPADSQTCSVTVNLICIGEY